MAENKTGLPWRKTLSWALLLLSFLWVWVDGPLRALWPSVVALGVVLLLRRVLLGLLAGGVAGALILSQGNPVTAFISFFSDHLIPALQSPWKIGAILFTFMLGGFSALIEKGGGLQALVQGFLNKGKNPGTRVQWSAFVLGLALFFDGLANSMMVGRMLRGLADRCGVSRVKLAYIVDSTSSAVACLAFVSTWIAVQLAMIREGFDLAGRPGDAAPYAIFFQSIPSNFYCIFTVFFLAVVIRKDLNMGSMASFEALARESAARRGHTASEDADAPHWSMAVLPVLVLILTLLLGTYVSGVDAVWPLTRAKIVEAFGGDQVVIVLVCASALASLIAYVLYPRHESRQAPENVFLDGVQALFVPVLILVGAWVLSSTLSQLDAAKVLSALLSDRLPLFAFPAAVFFVGALISFSTGSSWGTMIILMPLAVPVCFELSGDAVEGGLLSTVVGAVFSGAVFGDHCSPISDTTIVSSISCEVEPHDHVRTQMPYALTAAAVALFLGYLPAGLGVPSWVSLLVGGAFLWFLPRLIRSKT